MERLNKSSHIACHSPRQDLCMSDAVNEDEQLKQTCWLTFGSLVNVACWDEDRQRCPQIKQDCYMRVCIIEIKKKEIEKLKDRVGPILQL